MFKHKAWLVAWMVLVDYTHKGRQSISDSSRPIYSFVRPCGLQTTLRLRAPSKPAVICRSEAKAILAFLRSIAILSVHAVEVDDATGIWHDL